MTGIVVLGDELHGVGFRLAGIEVHNPPPAELEAQFKRAVDSAALVVLSQRCARGLAPALLRRAMLGETPPVVVMPDIGEPNADTGFVRRMRSLLGIET